MAKTFLTNLLQISFILLHHWRSPQGGYL